MRQFQKEMRSKLAKNEFIPDTRGGIDLVTEYTLGLVVVSVVMGAILFGLVDDTTNTGEEINKVQMDQATFELTAAIKSVDQSVQKTKAVNNAAVGSKWSKEDRMYVTVDMPDPASQGGYRVDVQQADGVRDYTVNATTGISEDISQRSTITTKFDSTSTVEQVGGLSSGRVSVYYHPPSDRIKIEQLRGSQ